MMRSTVHADRPGVVAPLHEVALYPATGGDLIGRLDRVGDELLAGCLDRADARALVRSALVSMGVDDEWQLRIDPDGPRPILERGDRRARHLADGCYVLGGTPNHGFVDLVGPDR